MQYMKNQYPKSVICEMSVLKTVHFDKFPNIPIIKKRGIQLELDLNVSLLIHLLMIASLFFEML